ncbi:MAG TPA: substrate-binding domain-containing protein [Gemmatimonadaceae bacterium]
MALIAAALAACGGREAPASTRANGSAALVGAAGGAPRHALRVCADPNNLPFSDSLGRGFENRIAELLARDLGDTVRYTWWAQRRGFVRNTLGAHRCDVIIGIDEGNEQVLTSSPYYRSTYVFVTRRHGGPRLTSFDDPRLRTLRVGLHVIGDDYNALPPGVAMARRGLVNGVRGYSIYGDYAQPNPPARLIEAVARGDVDVAVAWGPLAGYFARRSPVPLVVLPVTTPEAVPGVPFTYGIALGVRHGDAARLARLGAILRRRRSAVRAILRSYGVPLVDSEPARAASRSGAE